MRIWSNNGRHGICNHESISVYQHCDLWLWRKLGKFISKDSVSIFHCVLSFFIVRVNFTSCDSCHSIILRSYAKRAFQCNQRGNWISLVILVSVFYVRYILFTGLLSHYFLTSTHLHLCFKHQLTLDLMGVEQNSFLPYSNEMTEESCFKRCRNNNEISMCRLICCKKAYIAFFTGDLDTAAKMCGLRQAISNDSTGESVIMHLDFSVVSIFS